MSLQVDTTVTTSTGRRYYFQPDHRNGNPKKSQWSIGLPEELHCFENSVNLGWANSSHAWGLHCPGAIPEVLGHSPTGLSLKIAKFVAGTSTSFWHGYPANYRQYHQDRPPVSILRGWESCGLIKKYEVARVRGGKPCSLSD